MGVVSPTKLRMKLLMGSHGGGGGGGAKDAAAARKSPRASPSRIDDDDDDYDGDHPRTSLLPQELDEEYPKDRSDSSRSRSDASRGSRAARGCGGGSDGGLEAGGGNFEFCRDERAAAAAVSGPFFRQVPSKWNDAEKWIAGRHVVHTNPIFARKPAAAAPHSPGGGRVAPESKGGGTGSGSASALTGLSSKSSSPASVGGPPAGRPPHKKLRFSSAGSAVSMRDVGTKMTPIASKEQSRSGTPAGAATPSLSPLCSVPSSPRLGGGGGGASASSSASERELQLRTRRKIAALGLQLGKMSIASWASKEESLLAGEGRRRGHRWRDQEKGVRGARRGVGGVQEVWTRLKIPEEGGEDTGMGELPEIQIRSRIEAGRGACRGDESLGEAEACEEAVMRTSLLPIQPYMGSKDQ